MAAVLMLRRNVKLEIQETAICAALARQLHIPNNFTFAQPEKAIGHESQIEPWLALTTPLLDASETDERRYASKMNLQGLAISPAPCYFVFRSGSLQRAPAAAARAGVAGVPTFTLICFGFASSRFGMLSVSTPF